MKLPRGSLAALGFVLIWAFLIIFILDFTDNFFDDILHCHQTSHTAIFIDHNCHMDALRLHFGQKLIRFFSLRNKISRAQQIAQ